MLRNDREALGRVKFDGIESPIESILARAQVWMRTRSDFNRLEGQFEY